MKNGISAEEKLLRLIKSAPLKPPKQTKQPIPVLKYRPSLNLSKIIKAAFIISCIFLLFTFIHPFVIPQKNELPKIAAKDGLTQEAGLIPQAKPYDFYSQAIRDRKIFGEQVSSEAARPMSAINSDLIKDINLIGVILGDSPQAIIEDKKTQKSYYVNKGQFIGEFRVDDIQEGKVILTYEGEKFELYL